MRTDYYSEYDEVQRNHWWYLARAEILRDVLHRYLRPARSQLLLDIGCGPGAMRPMLSEFGTLVSTDVTFEALHFCVSQNLDHLLAADATKLPFRDGCFGAVCAFDVIEHLERDHAAAKEFHRVLKPGGVLVITVPACQFLWGRHDVINQHFRRYNAPQLRRLLTDARFRITKLSYFNSLLFPPIAVARVANRMLRLKSDLANDEVKSDFTVPHSRFTNDLLRRIFATEKKLLPYMKLPIGVSLLCVAEKTL